MTELLPVLLEISLVVFMAGNLLDMGLRLDPQDALRGLRNIRFVAYTLLFGFVLGPALALAITRAIPLEPPYAIGLILIGMTPCAPFMPLLVGMSMRRASPRVASRVRPVVRKLTGIATVATGVLCLIVYGKGLLGIPGSLALLAQLIFFLLLTVVPYGLGFGLPHEQRIVLSTGMATRNLGAAFAPLLALPVIDQRAIVMVVLGLPVMVLFALLAVRWFGRRAG